MAEKAEIILSARDQTKEAFASVQRSLSSLRGAVTKIPVIGGAVAGAFAVDALIGSVREVVDGADALAKASQKYGIAVEELSALKYAGALSDVSFEAIGTGMKALSVAMSEAARGAAEQSEAFKALGVAVVDANGVIRPTGDVLLDIAGKFSDMEDGAGKTALAIRLFGRSGQEMIPMLNAGKEGLADMADEVKRLGGLIGSEFAKNSERFNDNLTRIGVSMNSMKVTLLGGVIGSLAEFTDRIVLAIKATGGLMDAIRLFSINSDGVRFDKPAKEIERLTKALTDYQSASTLGKIAQAGPKYFLFGDKEADLKKQIAILKELQASSELSTQMAFVPPERKTKAPILSRAERGPSKEGRDDQITQMQQLGREYQRLWESADSYVGTISEQERLGRSLTESEKLLLDVEKKLPEEWRGSIRPLLDRARAMEINAERAAKVREMIEATPSAKLEVVRNDIKLLTEEFERYNLSEEQYIEAVQTRLGRLPEKIEAELDTMTEFVKEAARNMQDAMSDFFFDAMQGKFDDMGNRFAQTINRMVSNLMASQLSNFLFGDFGKSGNLGGALGNFIGGIFGGARAMGGPVMGGSAYLVGEQGPELFVPRTSGSIVPNAGSITINNSFTVANTSDRRSQQQIAAEVGVAVNRAMRRNR